MIRAVRGSRSVRRTRVAAVVTAATLLLGALGLAGCSDAGVTTVTVRLRGPDDPGLLSDVDAFVFEVEDAAGRPLVLRRAPADGGKLRLDDIPFGAGHLFRLEGLAGARAVVHGRSCPVDVVPDVDPPVVSLFASRVGAFASVQPPPSPGRTRPLVFAVAGGDLMLAGGADVAGRAQLSAESFNPRTGIWASEAPLGIPRRDGVSAPVGDNVVLVIGGEDDAGKPIAAPELFRPQDGFRLLPAERSPAGTGLRATSLPDGAVLLTGGALGPGPATDTARLFDGGEFSSAGRLLVPRRHHTVSVVGGRSFFAAFVIGGDAGAATAPTDAVEIFNPHARPGEEFRLESARLAAPRARHTATVLRSGEILIVGGVGPSGSVAAAEIFDPLTRLVRSAGDLTTARVDHTATLLPDGQVLVAGGIAADGEPTADTEIFDPSTGLFSTGPLLRVPRAGHVAVPLCDGTTLLVGGGAGAEIWNPGRVVVTP